MLSVAYDLHIHSCLSPCGDPASTPADIAGMAFIKGLDVFALTDHNSARNCPAAKAAADAYGILFVPGMELTTEEEVHVVCLFEEVEQALAFGEYVYPRILDIENKPEIFGEQLVADENDVMIACERRLLISATTISFDEVFALAEQFGGTAFPAHIEKAANSLLANLGFIPPDAAFHTAEMKNPALYETLCPVHTYLKQCRVLKNSDAHTLEDISEAVNFLHVTERTPRGVIDAVRRGLRAAE
ncbi:MAG: phosphoesterase [Oscillospiraceae bacterium]